MPVKELTKLTITGLWKEFNLSFKDYWQEHDEAVKAYKKWANSWKNISPKVVKCIEKDRGLLER